LDISALNIGGENDNTKGEKLYDFSNSQMDEKKYEYLIVDKEKDILLKDADLLDACKSYINFSIDIIKTIANDIKKYTSNVFIETHEVVKTPKKKSKRNRINLNNV